MNLENETFKGIWIPFQILIDKEISDKEKLILSLICFKSKIYGKCSLSNKYLSYIFNISETQCSKLVNSLAKKKYITIRLMYENNSKEIKNRIIIPQKFVLKYLDLGIKEKFNTTLTNVNVPIEHKFKDNIKYNKNNKCKSYYFRDTNYNAEELEYLYENQSFNIG